MGIMSVLLTYLVSHRDVDSALGLAHHAAEMFQQFLDCIQAVPVDVDHVSGDEALVNKPGKRVLLHREAALEDALLHDSIVP